MRFDSLKSAREWEEGSREEQAPMDFKLFTDM